MSLVLPWVNAGLLIVALALATWAHRRQIVAERRWQRVAAEREALRLVLEQLGNTVTLSWTSDAQLDIRVSPTDGEAVH